MLSARSISENAIPEEESDDAIPSNSSSNNYNSLNKFDHYHHISFDEDL